MKKRQKKLRLFYQRILRKIHLAEYVLERPLGR
jgi:hypothetical protein